MLNGHDHDYERFAPQDAQGGRDDARGIREFVVGTGGKNHMTFRAIEPNSELHDTSSFGFLELTLRRRRLRLEIRLRSARWSR